MRRDCKVTEGSVPVNLLVGKTFHGHSDSVPARRLSGWKKRGVLTKTNKEKIMF